MPYRTLDFEAEKRLLHERIREELAKRSPIDWSVSIRSRVLKETVARVLYGEFPHLVAEAKRREGQAEVG